MRGEGGGDGETPAAIWPKHIRSGGKQRLGLRMRFWNRVKTRHAPCGHGAERSRNRGRRLLRLAGSSTSALWMRCRGDDLGVLRRLEVGVFGNVVQQDGDMARDRCQGNLPWLAVGYEPLVYAAEDVVRATAGYRSHVESLPEVGSAALGLGPVLDRAALVVDGSVTAHLGDALRVEVADVGTVGEYRPRKARADAFDLLEPAGEIFHARVAFNCRIAFGLESGNLRVDLLDKLVDGLLHVGVRVVLKLVVDEGPGLHVVLARADGLFEAFLRFGMLLDEMKLRFLERCRVVADHFAVDGVGLLDAPLRFGKAPRLPGVKAHGLHALGEAFVGKRLLIWPCRLEADDGTEFRGPRDQFCPTGLDVLDVFLSTVWVADVKPLLADVNSYVHSDRIHDILSLSSSYGDLVSRMPLQPFRLWLMTKWRCPDSPAMYLYLGGNELTATARTGWPSGPGILFASACAFASPSPDGQEQWESISKPD